MTRLALAPPVAEKLGPLERIEALCDSGSVQLVRGEVVSRRMGERTSPGDGVVGATGAAGRRPLGEVQADTICRVLGLAGRARMPASVPDAERRVYDVRHVVRTLVDGGRALELNERWARNVVTAVARLDGHAVGIVANPL